MLMNWMAALRMSAVTRQARWVPGAEAGKAASAHRFDKRVSPRLGRANLLAQQAEVQA